VLNVTAIMPTRGRRVWANQALKCFLAQTYEHKDLIILDDEDNPSFPIPPKYPNVAHILLKERMSIAAKRNMAVRLATGEIICHVDSDDYSAPNRFQDQVALLEEHHKSVTGYHSMIFHDAERGLWYFKGLQGFPMGTSLMYRKLFWSGCQFVPDPIHVALGELNVGEDNMFARAARNANEVITTDAGFTMVARSHSDNVSKRDVLNREHQEWHRWTGGLPTGFTP